MEDIQARKEKEKRGFDASMNFNEALLLYGVALGVLGIGLLATYEIIITYRGLGNKKKENKE